MQAKNGSKTIFKWSHSSDICHLSSKLFLNIGLLMWYMFMFKFFVIMYILLTDYYTTLM